MDRPTKEQVDEALRTHAVAMPMCNGWVDNLADEVRALREDLAGAREALSRSQVECAMRYFHRGVAEKALTELYEAAEAAYDWAEKHGEETCTAFERLEAVLAKVRPRPCASSEPDTAPISTPDGQAAEPVVLENPAKQRGRLL